MKRKWYSGRRTRYIKRAMTGDTQDERGTKDWFPGGERVIVIGSSEGAAAPYEFALKPDIVMERIAPLRERFLASTADE